MSALPVLAIFYVPMVLFGLGFANQNAKQRGMPDSARIALEAVRKAGLRQLLSPLRLSIGSFIILAALAGLGGFSRGNGWIMPFVAVPVTSALALGSAWYGASAMLMEAGHQLIEPRVERALKSLARSALGATLLAHALGALTGLGLGAIDSLYGLRLGPWAATGIALAGVFVALAGATLEPLTLGARGREASPTNLGAAAALSLLRPMRSLIILFGVSVIAFDHLGKILSTSDPAQREPGTLLLLVLGGSAIATLMGGLAVRILDHEPMASGFRRGIASALAILFACTLLTHSPQIVGFPQTRQLWTVGLFLAAALVFFLPSVLRSRRTSTSIVERLGRAARVPFYVGAALLGIITLEPNLELPRILFSLTAAALPIALLSSIATDCIRGATHLAWLALHPSAAQKALSDESLEELPPLGLWMFGACLLAMEGPTFDLGRTPGPLLAALVLLGGLGTLATLALHRGVLDGPMRESEWLKAGSDRASAPLTRPAELGEKIVTRAGIPLLAFLAAGATLGLLSQSSLAPPGLSTPLALGLWLGALPLGVGLSGYFSGEPLSPRGSLGPLSLTLTLTLGTLLMSVQTIVF